MFCVAVHVYWHSVGREALTTLHLHMFPYPCLCCCAHPLTLSWLKELRRLFISMYPVNMAVHVHCLMLVNRRWWFYSDIQPFMCCWVCLLPFSGQEALIDYSKCCCSCLLPYASQQSCLWTIGLIHVYVAQHVSYRWSRDSDDASLINWSMSVLLSISVTLY